MPVPKSGFTFLRLGVMVALLSMSGGLSATAQTAGVDVAAPTKGFVLTASSRINNFDWLERPRHAQTVRFVPNRLRIVRQIGDGSYICSPAGSGRRSQCHSN
jgi:hypothetical protein